MKCSNVLRAIIGLACCGCGFFATFSCQSDGLPQNLHDAARSLNDLAQAEAEFGTATISVPVLDNPSELFQFNLSAGADAFYADAKQSKQGSASNFEQSSISGGLGVNATINPVAGAAFLSQLQQYQQAVGNNNAALAFANQKNALLNSAANENYQSAMLAAATLPAASRPAAIAAARTELANNLAGPTSTALPPYPTASTEPSAPTNLVSPASTQNFASNGSFAGFQALSPSSNLSVTDRTALLTAAGDNAVKSIFNILGDPKLATQFEGKKILFGVSTVAVNPGWRTKKGYAVDVAMTAAYRWVPAREITLNRFLKAHSELPKAVVDALKANPSNSGDLLNSVSVSLRLQTGMPPKGPRMVAISPLTDTQTLGLQDSYRNQTQMALSAAAQFFAAGSQVQGQAFLNYAKSLQQDFATVSPDVVANAYSSDSMFGYEIGPQLRAIEQEKQRQSSGPAQILERQSFPTLIMFGLDCDDLMPKITKTADGKLVLCEPKLLLQSGTLWVATDQGPAQRLGETMGFGSSSVPIDENKRLSLYYASESKILPFEAELTSHSMDLVQTAPTVEQEAKSMLVARARALQHGVIGSRQEIYLPLELVQPAKAVITRATPTTVPVDSPTDVALMGQGLENIDLSTLKIVQGQDATDKDPLPAQFQDGSIVVTVNPTDAGPLQFSVTTPSGNTIYSPAITRAVVPSVDQIVPMSIQPPTTQKAAATPAAGNAAAPAAVAGTATSAPAVVASPRTAMLAILGKGLKNVPSAPTTGVIDVSQITVVSPEETGGNTTATVTSAKAVGDNAILLTIALGQSTSPIYFKLPIVNNPYCKYVQTPSVTISSAANQPGANAGATTASGPPLVKAMTPATVELVKDASGKTTPQQVRVYIIGTGLDQVDLSTVFIQQGNATIQITGTEMPMLVGGTISLKVTFNEGEAVVVGFKAKGITDPIYSLPITVTTK